jgi:hypothetical protein
MIQDFCRNVKVWTIHEQELVVALAPPRPP